MPMNLRVNMENVSIKLILNICCVDEKHVMKLSHYVYRETKINFTALSLLLLTCVILFGMHTDLLA
jgi:hypothetical protein